MDYPYNYFITKKNVSINILKKNIVTNIFKTNSISILKKYESNIQSYIKDNKLNLNELENNKILEKISNYYDIYILNKQNIEYFFKLFIEMKDIINENENNILYFLAFNKNKEYLYDENNYLINPISHKNFKLGFLNKNYIETNNYLNDNVKLGFDILTQGDIINFSLPSIGPMYKYLSNNNNYFDFITYIINNKDIKLDITSKIPLTNLKLFNNINKCLLDISYKNITNNLSSNSDLEENLFNTNTNNQSIFNNQSIKNLIKRRIEGIQINLKDIFFTISSNNKKKDKLKSEFIIPYKIDKNEIKEMTKNEVDKIREYDKLVENNNNIFIYVIEDIFEEDHNKIKKLDNKNYKNVISCYLFYIINVLCKILNLYVDEINNILINVIKTKNNIVQILNIKSAFEYTSLLEKSVLKFKKILLNNFYRLFLPSGIEEGNYGMKVNDNGCYIPESNFVNSNDYIINKYPFHIQNPSKNIILKEDLMKEFLICVPQKTDIYDNKFTLEYGGLFLNKEIRNQTIKILINYYKEYQKYNKFNLFIIDKIINYINVDKNIPYEVMNEYLPLFINMSDPSFTKKILNIFEMNMRKTIDYYIKITKINSKIKILKKTEIKSFMSKKEIYELTFNTLRTKTLCIIDICEKVIQNTKDKNNIINKMFEIKKKYEDILKKYLKK